MSHLRSVDAGSVVVDGLVAALEEAQAMLADVERSLPDVLDVHALTAVAVTVRDVRADLAQLLNDVQRRLIAALAGKKFAEVPGLGAVRVRYAHRRTAWDHDALVAAAVARIMDEPSTLFDPFTGELLPYVAIGHHVAARLRECISFGGGKSGGLEAIGIDPSEYCTEDPAAASIELPPRKGP